MDPFLTLEGIVEPDFWCELSNQIREGQHWNIAVQIRALNSTEDFLIFCGREVIISPSLREWPVTKKITSKDVCIKILRMLRRKIIMWRLLLTVKWWTREGATSRFVKEEQSAYRCQWFPALGQWLCLLHNSWSPFLQRCSLLSIRLSSVPHSFFQAEVPLCAFCAKPLLTQSRQRLGFTLLVNCWDCRK